jgi:hypothetical protein
MPDFGGRLSAFARKKSVRQPKNGTALVCRGQDYPIILQTIDGRHRLSVASTGT